MMKNTFVRLIVLLSLFSGSMRTSAQSLPVGTPVVEDYYRRLQLLGAVDSATSFMIRPVFPAAAFNRKKVFFPDSVSDSGSIKKYWSPQIAPMPVSVYQLANSTVPTGWNDGSFIPVKGYQARISAGFSASYGPFTLQFQPELITAANEPYDGFDQRYPDFTWAQYYDFYQGIIDRPERFGTSSYSKLLPGQSSIRVNFAQFSLGFSTENLWWGPCQYNSLLMSNTAPGFNHFTFNTREPLRTPAGSFELQAIAGKLDDSGFTPPNADRRFQGNPLYVPRNSSWRYLSGLAFNWQPRWVPGLFLGYARTLQAYHRDLTQAYQIPLLLPFQQFDAYGDPQRAKYDQYYSLMARWLFPSANGEIYFEYGRNNHAYLYENYPPNSSHTRAYVAGIKKLIPLSNGTDQVQVNIEAAELNAPADYISKPGETWYVNTYVRQGYTHKGQLLGAGAGPGGSVQTLDVSWFRSMKRIGLQLERSVHNNDLYYYLFESVSDVRRHWVDMSLTANVQWDFNHILLSSKIAAVKLYNYQYYLDPANEFVSFAKGRDVINLRAELGFAYRF